MNRKSGISIERRVYGVMVSMAAFQAADSGKAVPDRVIIDGGCSKANCVAACDNIPGAFCLGDWQYWIFWERSKAVPDRVIIDGGCSKANCVAACDNIPGAFCLGDWQYWIFWEKSKCQCLVP
uniref:Ferredoxin n=1 Tax=Strongyloides venezuelensis TaxID=75913 RepID=A0A0K0FVP2_STRVS